MKNVKIGNVEVPLGGLIIAAGTLLILISLFMAYVKMSAGSVEETLSGFNIITGSVDGESLDGDQWSFVRWAPLIMLLTAVIALVMSVLPMFIEIPLDRKVYSVIVTVFGAISVLFGIIFLAIGGGPGLFADYMKESVEFSIEWGMEMGCGFGAFLGIIGSLACLIGAGLGLKENL